MSEQQQQPDPVAAPTTPETAPVSDAPGAVPIAPPAPEQTAPEVSEPEAQTTELDELEPGTFAGDLGGVVRVLTGEGDDARAVVGRLGVRSDGSVVFVEHNPDEQ